MTRHHAGAKVLDQDVGVAGQSADYGRPTRGVEIDSQLADDITRSVILDQVELGVAVRMACLDVLSRNLPGGGDPKVVAA